MIARSMMVMVGVARRRIRVGDGVSALSLGAGIKCHAANWAFARMIIFDRRVLWHRTDITCGRWFCRWHR